MHRPKKFCISVPAVRPAGGEGGHAAPAGPHRGARGQVLLRALQDLLLPHARLLHHRRHHRGHHLRGPGGVEGRGDVTGNGL